MDGDQQAQGMSVYFHWMRDRDLLLFVEEQRSWSFLYLFCAGQVVPNWIIGPIPYFLKSTLGAPQVTSDSLIKTHGAPTPSLSCLVHPFLLISFIKRYVESCSALLWCLVQCLPSLSVACVVQCSILLLHMFSFSIWSTLKTWMEAFAHLWLFFSPLYI